MTEDDLKFTFATTVYMFYEIHKFIKVQIFWLTYISL